MGVIGVLLLINTVKLGDACDGRNEAVKSNGPRMEPCGTPVVHVTDEKQ